jgi:hypothetical protein
MAGTKAAETGTDAVTLQTAADAFLSSPRCANPNTRRAYAGVIDNLIATICGQLLALLVRDQEKVGRAGGARRM